MEPQFEIWVAPSIKSLLTTITTQCIALLKICLGTVKNLAEGIVRLDS